MFFRRRKQSELGRQKEYATCADFADTFSRDMERLYLLALLLTGDHASADECFVSALDTCAERDSVFKDSAASWCRRSVVKSAIKLVFPASGENNRRCLPSEASVDSTCLLREVRQLPAFDRFVFVMSVLERYSDRDCSALLGNAVRDILPARIRALQQISLTDAYAGEPFRVPNTDWLEC
jgi:DNA-directed RNA polymerase specialized sigma24 family protein